MKYIVQPMFLKEAVYYDYSYEDCDIPHLNLTRFILCLKNGFDDCYENFKDFEDVESFLKCNESDWQEAGYYNAAHVFVLDDEEKVVREEFYSVLSQSFIQYTKNQNSYFLTDAKLELKQSKKFYTNKSAFNKKFLGKELFAGCKLKIK